MTVLINKKLYEMLRGWAKTAKLNKNEEIEFSYTSYTSLHEILASFFMKHGVICSTSKAKDIIKNLQKRNRIDIIRNPSRTKKGKPTTFMTEGKGQTVHIRWLS